MTIGAGHLSCPTETVTLLHLPRLNTEEGIHPPTPRIAITAAHLRLLVITIAMIDGPWNDTHRRIPHLMEVDLGHHLENLRDLLPGKMKFCHQESIVLLKSDSETMITEVDFRPLYAMMIILALSMLYPQGDISKARVIDLLLLRLRLDIDRRRSESPPRVYDHSYTSGAGYSNGYQGGTSNGPPPSAGQRGAPPRDYLPPRNGRDSVEPSASYRRHQG